MSFGSSSTHGKIHLSFIIQWSIESIKVDIVKEYYPSIVPKSLEIKPLSCLKDGLIDREKKKWGLEDDIEEPPLEKKGKPIHSTTAEKVIPKKRTSVKRTASPSNSITSFFRKKLNVCYIHPNKQSCSYVTNLIRKQSPFLYP